MALRDLKLVNSFYLIFKCSKIVVFSAYANGFYLAGFYRFCPAFAGWWWAICILGIFFAFSKNIFLNGIILRLWAYYENQ